jgi:hypothetical protein
VTLIPEGKLGNDIAAVLRRAEQGERYTTARRKRGAVAKGESAIYRRTSICEVTNTGFDRRRSRF